MVEARKVPAEAQISPKWVFKGTPGVVLPDLLQGVYLRLGPAWTGHPPDGVKGLIDIRLWLLCRR